MKLYYHPVSTTSRPVVLFAHESGIELDYQVVDLFTGEQYKPEYEAINPSHQVPVLEDGDFRLTESSAILKYLADKKGSPAYPKDPAQRARVNERMDWFNTRLLPRLLLRLRLPADLPVHAPSRRRACRPGRSRGGKEKALGWLKVLDQNLIGPRNGYLCGDAITIADYLGARMIIAGEAIGCSLAPIRTSRAGSAT